MKRFILLAAAVAATLVTGVTPAKADHHPACTSTPIVQHIWVFDTGSTLDFGGDVQCIGAASAAITNVHLKQLAGATTLAPLDSFASCTNCTGMISALGSAPIAVGVYEVMMNFTAEQASTGRLWNTFRSGWFLVVPGVDTFQVCGHGAQLACPTTLPV